jgi:hypothetical protein
MLNVGNGVVPFFDMGPAQPAAGPPLGVIAGGLILDSGEAERTFIFRCQDRYLAYNTLHGLRTVLFVADDEHVRYYRDELAGLHQSWDVIAAECGVLPAGGPPEPLFVACDIDRLRLGACWALLDQLRRSVVPRDVTPRLYLNQISPTYADLVGQLDRLLRDHGLPGGFDGDACARLGELALRFHNKARYVELVQAHGGAGLPAHVPTAVIAPERFLAVRRWSDLVHLYRERTGDGEPAAIFVKSAQDSSGNVAARLTEETFDLRAGALRREIEQHILGLRVDLDERARELRAEVDAAPALRPLALTDDRLRRYKRLQAERRTGIDLLVQREVAPPADLEGRFVSIGASFQIGGPERIELIEVAAQLYRDPERRSYLGSYLSPAIERSVIREPFDAELRRLCRLFAEQGWRGPINFDARLAADGAYQLIYDCNPRLTAVFPALAVRAALRAQGLSADSVLSLGYRGEFVWIDLPARLAMMSARGLLYTRERQRGAVVLPNLSRRHGFDVVFVNLEPAAVADALASGALGESGALSVYV